MASVNKAIILGNIGRDPEVKNGATVVSIATTSKWKDKNSGEMKEETEWHRVVFFGKLADIAAQYLSKGKPVYVEGRLKTTKYQKDGADHYSTQIVADSMQMLGARGDAGDKPSTARKNAVAAGDGFEDDIPF